MGILAREEAGAQSTLVEIPGENHNRMVLTLSRADKPATAAMLDFIWSTTCSGRPAAAGALGSARRR